MKHKTGLCLGGFVLSLLFAACSLSTPASAPTVIPPTLVFPTREATPSTSPTAGETEQSKPINPTETLAATATSISPGSEDNPLQLAGLDSVPPEDVIREMYLYQGGANPGANCINLYEPDSLWETRLPNTVVLQFCWDDPDDSVHLTVTLPDERQEVYDLPVRQSELGNYVIGLYPVGLSRQPGLYHFRLQGGQREVSFAVRFAPAALPVVYEVLEMSDEWQVEGAGLHHRLHLAGFAPNEALRLLVYHSTGGRDTWIGWQAVTAGPDGQVWVDMQLEQELVGGWLEVFAVGPASGVVQMHGPVEGFGDRWEWIPVCPGALPSRLSFLPAVTLREVSVYEKPSLNAMVTGSLEAGTEVMVFSGPNCREGALWWAVAAGEVTGYILETSGQEYWLAPVE